MRTATTTWITLAALGLGGLAVAGCEQNNRDTQEEATEGMQQQDDTFGNDGLMNGNDGTMGDTMEEGADDAGDTMEEGADQTGDAMEEGAEDTGDAMQGNDQQ